MNKILLRLAKRAKGDNYLFLDFDGVIITAKQEIKEHVALVDRLCKTHDLKVVISSSWREYLPECTKVLREAGFEGEIAGATDLLGDDRNKQILRYLRKHQYHKFVILDDLLLRELVDFQVKTDYRVGFDEQAYMQACAILLKQK
ncbi:MAG: HAD domain-containing protein [Erysipelotrichaceae bacterium]|nr:HAD domain-containing protein [Erysipelotrichaceae bacterium]MDY5251523.1 HAD domain-containing protein [Erysipelotrichaceae bacterium]